MDNQRSFIADPSTGKPGHDMTALLDSHPVSQLQLAAIARTNQPEDERQRTPKCSPATGIPVSTPTAQPPSKSIWAK